MGRVLGQESVEQGGASAGQPKDEEWPLDALFADLGVTAPVVEDRQPGREKPSVFKGLAKLRLSKTCYGMCSDRTGWRMIRRSAGYFDHTGLTT